MPEPPVDVSVLRSRLGSTVEEWKVIGPLLAKVDLAMRELSPETGAGPNFGMFGNPDDWVNGSFTGPGETARGNMPAFGRAPATKPAAETAPATAPGVEVSAAEAEHLSHGVTLRQALADLHTLLAQPSADEAAVARQVALVREARQRAQEALDDARAELRPLLTARQEAMLAALGYLEE
jgi:hypothetical protein